SLTTALVLTLNQFLERDVVRDLDVGLEVPGPGPDRALLLVLRDDIAAVADVPPQSRELAGKVHRRPGHRGSAPREAVRHVAGERRPGTGLHQLLKRGVLIPRESLGDDDRRLHLLPSGLDGGTWRKLHAELIARGEGGFLCCG